MSLRRILQQKVVSRTLVGKLESSSPKIFQCESLYHMVSPNKYTVYSLMQKNPNSMSVTTRMMSSNNESSSSNTPPKNEESFKNPESKDNKEATDTATEADGEEEEQKKKSREEELEEEMKRMKDQMLRSLAEQENTRRIAKRDVESARQFAISSFAKSLLETADNLSRAMESVPPELLVKDDSSSHAKEASMEQLNATLHTLYEGIQMTEVGLIKAFEKNGLTRFGNIGDAFDPNMHEALFEYAEENKAPGTVGQIMKKGFALNGRTIRPAEVGVIKKQ